MNIHGAPWASLLCYTVSMVPNLYFVCKYTRYRFDVMGVVVKPLIATMGMGACVWLIWHFGFGDVEMLNRWQLIAGVMICVIAGMVVYGVLALVTGTVRKEDLPARLRRIAK